MSEEEILLYIINYGVESAEELLESKKAIQQIQNPEGQAENEDKKAVPEENE